MSGAGRPLPDAPATGRPEDSPDAPGAPGEPIEEQEPEPPPRPVVRADLRAALGVFVAVALTGLPLGALWALLAPPEVVAVLADPTAGDGGVLPFVGQDEHLFDGLALFVLLGIAAGVLTGTALWLWRRRRGPTILVAGVLGALVAAWIALRFGLALADWGYPAMPVTPGGHPGGHPEQTLHRAPVLESAWGLVAQPFAVAIAYSFAVAWNGTPDLDRPEP